MQDPISRLNMMTRPRVLIDAAQAGAAQYHRARDLRRVIGARAIGRVPGHGAAMMILFDKEAELEDQRQVQDARYHAVAHVAALTALLAEAQLLRTSTRDAAKPPGQ
ncbi:DUF6477 family protein [Pseudooceanicola sp. MF1-13]|uniref:DUF6477 family protein n=1 Tax=Pseudooceanicola sp. MF1-13 TaxID=3379095 RepID=UPI0038922AF0